jgi:hypothetical protein
MCDNQRRIGFPKNPTLHLCTKHINVQLHFIQKRLKYLRNMFETMSNNIHYNIRSYIDTCKE